jgi:hypothetical protein
MDLRAKSNTGVLLFWPQWPPGTGPTDRIGLSDAHNHSARVTGYSYIIRIADYTRRIVASGVQSAAQAIITRTHGSDLWHQTRPL